MIRTTALAGLCLSAALVLSGCTSDEESAPEETSAQASETATEAVIAEDFPSDLVPEYPGSEPQYSSTEPADDGRLSFVLASSTDDESDAVLDFYTEHFEELDFSMLNEQEDGDQVSRDFQRSGGTELVIVSVTPDPDEEGASLVTVSGTVSQEAAEETPEDEEETPAEEGDQDSEDPAEDEAEN